MQAPVLGARGRAYYTLAVLTGALLVATIDKGVLSVLVEYIKRDLHVTDTQFSLLSGFAFVFFYALLGLPIARLADRHSRRLIIGLGVAFWSITTVLSGIAQSFQQLFWARVAVGAGESSLAPATYSILTDSFPRDRLPMAIAVLSLGFVCGGGFDDANLRVLQMATVAVLPTSILYPLMPAPTAALSLYALNVFFASVGIGPGNAALQIVTPNQMRGQIRALFQLVFNFVGFAIGPVFVALFTDHVFHGQDGVRYSLSVAAAITCPLAVALTWWGTKPYAQSVVRAAAWE